MAAFRTVICGSPQPDGRCAKASAHLADVLRDRFPEDGLQLFDVAHMDVHPCLGCNHCAEDARCILRDDMDGLLSALAESAELFVVCPVYFAGPPAQMKAVLDRMQPLFFTDVRNRPKRPAHLLVVGGGGDPHGFEPLVGIMRSALSVAGFRLDRVEASIGEDLQGVLSRADALLAMGA